MKYNELSKEQLIEILQEKDKKLTKLNNENILLNRNKLWLEKAQNNANVMIFYMDLKGNFTKVTPRISEMLGYTAEELLTKNIWDITHPDDIEENRNKFKQLVERKVQTYDFEKRYISKAGQEVYVFVNCVLVSNDEGVPIHTLAYLTDITERKIMENQIKRDAKIVKEINDQVAMYVSENEKLMFELRRFRHDTLNILYGLNGFIETKNWEGLRNYFNEIQGQVKVLKDNNPFSIEKVKNLAVRGLLTAKLIEAQKSHVAMNLEIEKDVKLDGRYMKNTDLCELLGIYLDNAIEAAGQSVNKKVSICIFEDDGCISIIIENTYKNRKDTTIHKSKYLESSKDRGLGLRLSKRIIGQYTNVLHNTFAYQQTFIQELHILKEIQGR